MYVFSTVMQTPSCLTGRRSCEAGFSMLVWVVSTYSSSPKRCTGQVNCLLSVSMNGCLSFQGLPCL